MSLASAAEADLSSRFDGMAEAMPLRRTKAASVETSGETVLFLEGSSGLPPAGYDALKFAFRSGFVGDIPG
jgi:hypothetical protein